LKEQLLNLEKVFEKQMKTMNHLEEELYKKQSKINQLTQELNAQKNVTKEKEKTILKFCNDVHKYVQAKEEKAYVQGLMKLNQDYVMPRSTELLDKKKKDPETIEELDRQLRYMERSIATLKVNTIKNEQRTKNDIKKRTKENTQLIQDLNAIRVEKMKLLSQIEDQKLTIKKYEIELKKRNRELAENEGAKTFVRICLINVDPIKNGNGNGKYEHGNGHGGRKRR
jgi:TolA-binding protein